MEVGETTDLAMAILCTRGSMCRPLGHEEPAGERRHATNGSCSSLGPRPTPSRGSHVLYLDLRPSYRVEVPEGDHNLLVAAAAKQAGSGTWRLLAAAACARQRAAGRTTRITMQAKSRIRGSRMAGLRGRHRMEGGLGADAGGTDAAAPAPRPPRAPCHREPRAGSSPTSAGPRRWRHHGRHVTNSGPCRPLDHFFGGSFTVNDFSIYVGTSAGRWWAPSWRTACRRARSGRPSSTTPTAP